MARRHAADGSIVRVLVTGGAGFIGANLVRHLSTTSDVTELRVIDDLSSGSVDNLDLSAVRLFEGSILDERLLAEATSDVDAVVHLAARPSVVESVEQPELCHEVNSTGTVRVLEACRRAGGAQVVVASSAAVYGSDATCPKHESLPPDPRSPYAASKLTGEHFAMAYAAAYDLPALVFRFFNVYGPLQAPDHAYAAVVPAFVSAVLGHRPVKIYGDGCQTRDMTFVGSIVRVIADALRRRIAAPGPVNLAFGTRRSILDILQALEAIVGPIDREHLPERPGDVRHSQADGRRLRELFPDIGPDDFTAGLAATVDWMKSLRR
jgi:UDP-glucose 4-epimerase